MPSLLPTPLMLRVCVCIPHPTLTLSNHMVNVWPTRPIPLYPVTSRSSVPLGLRFGLPTGGNRLPHPPGVCHLLRGSRVSVRVPAGVCVYVCVCVCVCARVCMCMYVSGGREGWAPYLLIHFISSVDPCHPPPCAEQC